MAIKTKKATPLIPDSIKKEDTAQIIPLCYIISQHDVKEEERKANPTQQTSCCDPLRSFGCAVVETPVPLSVQMPCKRLKKWLICNRHNHYNRG